MTTEAERFIAHYASDYYDPAKAHEYYLKNRELKGQRSTSGLTIKGNKDRSEQRKQAWAYAKNQINEKHKQADKDNASTRESTVDQAQATAQARREEIGNKLKNLIAALTAKQTEKSEQLTNEQSQALADLDAKRVARVAQIREEANRKIDALPPIPKGVSPARRAVLEARRASQVESIQGTVKKDVQSLASEINAERQKISEATAAQRTDLSDQTRDAKTGERTGATASREAVSGELKATVEKARSAFQARKESLKAEFEDTAQREYDAIQKRV